MEEVGSWPIDRLDQKGVSAVKRYLNSRGLTEIMELDVASVAGGQNITAKYLVIPAHMSQGVEIARRLLRVGNEITEKEDCNE